MTVYVDNARIPATIGPTRAVWSHLTADSPEELLAFAETIGLDRAWFQARCKYGSCPAIDGACRHFHIDVVARKRVEAIAAGAQAIDMRELGAIISARAEHFRAGGAS